LNYPNVMASSARIELASGASQACPALSD